MALDLPDTRLVRTSFAHFGCFREAGLFSTLWQRFFGPESARPLTTTTRLSPSARLARGLALAAAGPLRVPWLRFGANSGDFGENWAFSVVFFAFAGLLSDPCLAPESAPKPRR